MPKEASPAADLGTTAFWTAAVRAREQAREDRLFDDPWAAELAGEVGQRWIDQRSPESVVAIALRTRYFDDYLQRVASDGASGRMLDSLARSRSRCRRSYSFS